jgi:hypothetical protein
MKPTFVCAEIKLNTYMASVCAVAISAAAGVWYAYLKHKKMTITHLQIMEKSVFERRRED